MTPIKNYIAEQFLNKKFHFVCDCIIPLDITGIVKDYEIVGHEIVLTVMANDKLIHIGLNTSSLQVKEL